MFWATKYCGIGLAAVLSGLALASAAQVPGVSLERNGALSWTNAAVPGVCTVELAASPAGPWQPATNQFSMATSGSVLMALGESARFYRVRTVETPATPQGFTNLVNSYGLLETVAGSGAGQLDISYWQPYYEGLNATWVALSRPHYAMADRAGNLYVADKNSHSILKVSPEGILTTLAGTHTAGFNGEGPAPATALQLNYPNGEWVRADGTVYVFDTDNGRIRRVTTNGVMTTLFMATTDGSAVSGGRGLWVKDDESVAYFCADTKVRKWTPAGGVKTLASNFVELGDLVVDGNGNVIVCDRGAHLAYRITPAGAVSILAGNGATLGGGDGYLGTQTGLYGVRGVWLVPTGGYLLLTHDGCQLWYLDSGGVVRLLLNGARGRTHYGDGEFFYGPEARISEGRSVTMDYAGNILVCESDYGYVRRIRFLPMNP